MKHMLSFFVAVVFWGVQCLQAQWVQTIKPYEGSVMCLTVNGSNLFAGTLGGGVFLSTNNGAGWGAVNAGLTELSVQSLLAVNGSGLFAGTFCGGVFFRTNNDTRWTNASIGLTCNYPHVYALTVSGPNLFAGTWGGGVYRSTNSGMNWTAMNTGLTNPFVSALAVNDANLFVGTNGGVFLSTNNGTSWTAVNAGLTNSYVSALAVNGSNLFAGTIEGASVGVAGGVFLSTNNGTSWTAAGLTNLTVRSFAVNGSILFAATERGGVFLSTNNGTNWTAVNTGLTDIAISSLAMDGTNLFAGTYAGRIWRRPLAEMLTGVKDEGNPAPIDFTLEQNYPNPFWSEATSHFARNPQTTIRYQLPKTTQVVLKIYNTFGQEVRTLINARQPAGVNAVVWDGKDESGKEVSSGVYIYRLQAGESIQSRKLSFVR